MLGRRWRYLEIINHIVTRRADEEREARARRWETTDSMDLSDTLINSKLLITDPALRAAISSSSRRHSLQKATAEHCLRLTMQCQHDQSHALAPIIINNYLTELQPPLFTVISFQHVSIRIINFFSSPFISRISKRFSFFP